MNNTETIQNTDRVEGANNQAREYWLRVLRAVLIVLSVLAGVAFWGTFIYAMVVKDAKLAIIFGQIIGVMVGVFVPVSILYKLYQIVKKS